ncbi:hypothetical protein H0H81_010204 [Sphagnurus paluster]|uniref:Hemerythrin-like domain-containing protein n=1 Tax=Sphagnurus paluster TaxID=117069 RepID=A0A9P7FVB8_9AGAR|nr:hypothetical protein H0H81_010204 [Sphagnurus paluster]
MPTTIEILRSSVETLKNASLGSIPKDLYVAQRWAMAGAHGMMMNGLLCVYEKSDTIPADKTQVFVEYALQWVAMLEEHHEWEDKHYYPLFAPKFKTEAIMAEHETFSPGVGRVKEYLVLCLPAGATWGYSQTVPRQPQRRQEKFDGAKLRTLIDGFVNELSTHLVKEIEDIGPEKLREAGLTQSELKRVSDETAKYMRSMVRLDSAR